LNDVEVCLGSISRKVLSREQYSRLAAAERGDVSDSIRYDIMRRDGFKCVICGAERSQGVRLHVDHIVPIAKGGKSVPSNLRTLCERCNVGKSDKLEIAREEKQLQNKTDDPFVCPQCGNKLVWRKGKYGEFIGCTAYPKCRYTRNTVSKQN
jgi:5-methylcytosine-specific restriction endonuclease McrA